ncbi:MAG: hypothetical protein WAW37_14230 [Syntrophobacteraceae bacterium]
MSKQNAAVASLTGEESSDSKEAISRDLDALKARSSEMSIEDFNAAMVDLKRRFIAIGGQCAPDRPKVEVIQDDRITTAYLDAVHDLDAFVQEQVDLLADAQGKLDAVKAEIAQLRDQKAKYLFANQLAEAEKMEERARKLATTRDMRADHVRILSEWRVKYATQLEALRQNICTEGKKVIENYHSAVREIIYGKLGRLREEYFMAGLELNETLKAAAEFTVAMRHEYGMKGPYARISNPRIEEIEISDEHLAKRGIGIKSWPLWVAVHNH